MHTRCKRQRAAREVHRHLDAEVCCKSAVLRPGARRRLVQRKSEKSDFIPFPTRIHSKGAPTSTACCCKTKPAVEHALSCLLSKRTPLSSSKQQSQDITTQMLLRSCTQRRATYKMKVVCISMHAYPRHSDSSLLVCQWGGLHLLYCRMCWEAEPKAKEQHQQDSGQALVTDLPAGQREAAICSHAPAHGNARRDLNKLSNQSKHQQRSRLNQKMGSVCKIRPC